MNPCLRIYSIDDVFTPIKDGEIMPSDRYTEIYMEGGGKETTKLYLPEFIPRMETS